MKKSGMSWRFFAICSAFRSESSQQIRLLALCIKHNGDLYNHILYYFIKTIPKALTKMATATSQSDPVLKTIIITIMQSDSLTDSALCYNCITKPILAH